MVLSDKTRTASVLLMIILMVHGFTLDLSGKVRIANPWSDQYIRDSDVGDGKEIRVLEGTNTMPVLPAPPGHPDGKDPPGQPDGKYPPGQPDGKYPPAHSDVKYPPGYPDGKDPPGQPDGKDPPGQPDVKDPPGQPDGKNPLSTVDTKATLPITYLGAIKNRKKRQLSMPGSLLSSTKCSKNLPLSIDEHNSHSDPVPEPDSLLMPTPPSRVSNQQSTSLPTLDRVLFHDHLIPPHLKIPVHPEDKDLINTQIQSMTLSNSTSRNDEDCLDSEGEESSDSLNLLVDDSLNLLVGDSLNLLVGDSLNLLVGENLVLDPSLSPSTVILRSLCPAQFCRNQEDRQDYEEDGQEPDDTCCLPCHCTNECNVNATCCAENNFFSNNSQPTPPTREVCTNPAFRLRRDRRYTQSYMMVSTCSPFFTNLNYVTKCEKSDNLTMDSLTPIYHHETGLTYRNIFCAICNFATTENVTQWVPKLSCEQYFETYFVFTKPFNIYSDVMQNAKDTKLCDVIWDPIDVPSKPCYRRQDLVSSCPARASPTMMELCEDNELIAPILNMGIAYRNIYCLLCTTKRLIQEVCIKRDPMRDHRVEVFLNTDVFNGVLTENESLSEPQNISNSACGAGFEMDKELMTCGQMSCSASKVNVNGVCQPLYDRVKGAGFQFSLSLQYQAIPPKADVLVDIHEFLPDTLMICEEDIMYQLTETATVQVRYWATMVSNAIVSIHELYNEFEQRVKSHKKDEFTVEIGDAGYMGFPFEFTNYVSYELLTKFTDCPSTIAMDKIQFCDSIIIDYTFTEFDVDRLMINGYKFKPNEYLIRTNATGPKYVQICRDTLEMHDISPQKVMGTDTTVKSTGYKMPSAKSSDALGFRACIWNVAAIYILFILIKKN